MANELDRQELLQPIYDLMNIMSGTGGSNITDFLGGMVCGKNNPLASYINPGSSDSDTNSTRTPVNNNMRGSGDGNDNKDNANMKNRTKSGERYFEGEK